MAGNADMVGAINILRTGHARFACGVNSEVGGQHQQQEPAEAIQQSDNASLDAIGISCLARGGCQRQHSVLAQFF